MAAGLTYDHGDPGPLPGRTFSPVRAGMIVGEAGEHPVHVTAMHSDAMSDVLGVSLGAHWIRHCGHTAITDLPKIALALFVRGLKKRRRKVGQYRFIIVSFVSPT